MSKVIFYIDEPINLKGFKNTYEKCFNRSFDEKYWEWRYLKNPFSNTIYIGYVKENEKILAFLGSSPYKIKLSDKSIKDISYLNIVFTHPEYQGKGLFNTVVQQTIEKLKNSGFIASYGFANSNSHYGFRKHMNWIDLSILNSFQIDNSQIKTIPTQNSNFHFKFQEIDEKTIEEMLKMKYQTSKICIYYSFQYLKWRLQDIPTQKYFVLKVCSHDNTVGFVVLKNYGKEIDLMEFFHTDCDSKEKESVLSSAIFYLLKQYEKLNIWSNLHSDEHLFLEKIGFKETIFNTYFGIIPFQNHDEILNYKNWHIRFMDSDVY